MKRTLFALFALVACIGLVVQAGALTVAPSDTAGDDLYVAKLLGFEYVALLDGGSSEPRRLCDVYDTATCRYSIDLSLGCCVGEAQSGSAPCPNVCR